MSSSSITIALVLAFFAWMVWIGWRTHFHNKEADENFLIGNRAVSASLVAIGVIMGWTNGFSFGFTTVMAHDQGWYIFWIMAGISLCFVFLYFFAGKIRDNAAKSGAYMMGNYFSKEFSSRTSAVVGIANFIYFFIWLCVEFTLGGQVLSQLTNIPYFVVIGSMGLVTMIYLWLGGFLASVRTDLWQFIVFAAFILLIGFLWYPDAPKWIPPFKTAFDFGWAEALVFTIINLCAAICAPDVWQRIYSARSNKEAQSSCLYLAIGTAFMTFFFASLGMIIKANGFAETSEQVPSAIFTHLVPSWALAIAMLAFMAAIMSTVATTLFGAAMTVSSDVMVELKFVKAEKLPVVSRWLMLIILIAALVFSLIGIDLVTLAFTCLSVVQIVFPLVILMLFGVKISERAAFWSLVISLAAFIAGAYYNIYTGPYGLLPLGFAIVSLAGLEGFRIGFQRVKAA